MKSRYRPSTYIDVLRTIFQLNPILHVLARVLPGGFSVRPFLHRLRGVKIYGDIWIGDDVYLGGDYPETVEIYDGVAIATRCTIIPNTKGAGKIIIRERAAIGAGSTIICASGKSITIGEGAVISAGSTVMNDIPPYTLCGPPRIKAFGHVTVPFQTAATYEEFIRGVRPLRTKKKPDDSSNPATEAVQCLGNGASQDARK